MIDPSTPAAGYPACTRCGRQLVKRSGRRGDFAACPSSTPADSHPTVSIRPAPSPAAQSSGSARWRKDAGLLPGQTVRAVRGETVIVGTVADEDELLLLHGERWEPETSVFCIAGPGWSFEVLPEFREPVYTDSKGRQLMTPPVGDFLERRRAHNEGRPWKSRPHRSGPAPRPYPSEYTMGPEEDQDISML